MYDERTGILCVLKDAHLWISLTDRCFLAWLCRIRTFCLIFFFYLSDSESFLVFCVEIFSVRVLVNHKLNTTMHITHPTTAKHPIALYTPFWALHVTTLRIQTTSRRWVRFRFCWPIRNLMRLHCLIERMPIGEIHPEAIIQILDRERKSEWVEVVSCTRRWYKSLVGSEKGVE